MGARDPADGAPRERTWLLFLLKVMAIAFGAEGLITFILPLVLPANTPLYLAAIADASLLAVMVSLPIWDLAVRPLKRLTTRPMVPAMEKSCQGNSAGAEGSAQKKRWGHPYLLFFLKVLAIAFTAEGLIMFILPWILPADTPVWLAAVLDASSLAVMVSLPIWDLAVQPLRRLAREINQAHDWSRHLMDTMPGALLTCDSLGRVVEFNQRAEKLLGYKRKTILGQPVSLLVPKRFQKRHAAGFKTFFPEASQEPIQQGHLETLARRADGSEVVVEISLARFTRDGQNHVTAVLRDLTEARALEGQRRLQAAALEASAHAIAITDRQGVYLWANCAFSTLTGYSHEEILDKTPSILCSHKHPLQFYRKLWETILGGQVWEGEIINRRKDGSEYVEWQTITPVPDERGAITHFITVKQDISQRKEKEAELKRAKLGAEEASRAKASFLANMSHEIRTPLNAVLGMTELLLDTKLTLDQRDCLETIQGSGQVLLEIINDILDFSKMEAGHMELEQRPFELQTCVEEVLAVVAVRAAQKGLELTPFDFEGPPLQPMLGDARRLKQVLINLLGNAIKFTEKGAVGVRGRRRATSSGAPMVCLEVWDTGVGVPEERQEQLFQAFTQADPSISRKYGGTGLGLAISARMVSLMGGKLELESRPGEGTIFRFSILAAPAEGKTGKQAIQDLSWAAGKQVLVVDHQAASRSILARKLESLGLLAQEAASGEEALVLLARGQEPDLLLVAEEMPGMDGLTLLRHLGLREQAPPTLALMVKPGPGQKEFSGADVPFLRRPVRSQCLLKLLASLWGGPAGTAQGDAGPEPEYPSKLDPSLRILLAEDNPVNVKVALRMLQRLGLKAKTAGNGLEVIQALEQETYDLILMDVQMPGMDGLEATRTIRRRWPERPLHIIALTADALAEDRQVCLEAGMDAYLSKPLGMARLREAILGVGVSPSGGLPLPR